MASDIRTIIINCSTRELSTLALASALRHDAPPVTVIDCESTDESVPFFRRLQSRMPFTLEQMPLRRHGASLDRIFAESNADALLLLDSDAEIVSGELVSRLVQARAPGNYGCGFVHEGQWLGANHLVAGQVGYYAPRMWIPCVLLEVAPIKKALAAGHSFLARTVGNEVAQSPLLSQLLQLRFRLPVLRRLRFDSLRANRGVAFGVTPHYFYYDTGATMHQHLLAEGFRFADLGAPLWTSAVRHGHGITRRRLKRRMRNAAEFETARIEALDRIERVYGWEVPELKSQR